MRAASTRRRRSELPLVALVCALAACTGKVAENVPGSGGAAHGSGGSSASGATTAAGGSSAQSSGGSSTGGSSAGGSSAGGSSGTSSSGSSAGGSAQAGSGAVAPAALQSVGRRLTNGELDNVVRDLFGDSTGPASKYLAEDQYDPFDNDYTLQRASSALIDSLEAFAEDVAVRAVLPENRGKVVPCTPSGAGDSACFQQTVTNVGKKLFRRPLSADEVTPYLALQTFATENNPDVPHDFYTGVSLVLEAMLQDPEFLYRVEVGTPGKDASVLALNDYEIASRLSFLLWGSTPDDTLLTAADGGKLVDPAGRRAQAERLLADTRARDALHRFHAMWLGYRAIPGSAALLASFGMETTHLIDRVVFDEPASYLTLFTSPDTYIDDTLADQYGLPHPTGGEGWVKYGSDGRAGILSHGSVLAAFSKFSDTSPTQRGIFVQTRLLCNSVGAPPANVNVDQPPAATDSVCKVDRYSAHRSSSSCASCHDNLDPIGFGLEQYDIGGKFRTHDDGHPECPLDGNGTLPGYGTFNGPAELGQKLVDSGVLEHCFVQQLLDYAVGRPLRTGEDAVVDELAASFKAENYDAQTLLLDFVTSDRFALRSEEPAP